MDERMAALIESLLDEEARVAQLAELDDEALAGLADELRTAADGYRGRDDYSDDDLEEIRRIRAAFDAVAAEQVAREEAAAQEAVAAQERAAQAEEALAELATPTEPESDDPDPEPDDVEAAAKDDKPPAKRGSKAKEDDEAEPQAPPVPLEEQPRRQPQPMRNRRPSLAELAARPAQPEPAGVTHSGPRWQLNNGKPTTSKAEIAERVNAARESLVDAPQGFREKVVVASIRADYPTERSFDAGDDPEDNMKKLEPILASARHPEQWDDETKAIVASGGFCAPAEPRYDVYNIADASRPVTAALARVGVTRGAITVVPAAHLNYIVTSGAAGSAVSKWTNATDIAPGGTTKPYQTFGCRTTQTCQVQAIIARGRFGNFMGRAFPELVADDVDLMMAAHARVAEVTLLDCLIDGINMDVAQTGFFGTARDIKDHSLQVAADIRYWERSNTPIRAIPPRELLDMIVVDVLNQQASGEVQALMVDNAWAQSFLRTTGLLWSYAMDVSTGADAFQFATDGANLPDWPDDFEIPYFPEGSALFLDGGRLDLGIVRDSTLNSTNDYEMFVETFEGCCFLGPYGMTLTLTTCPNGESQAPSDVSTLCSGS